MEKKELTEKEFDELGDVILIFLKRRGVTADEATSMFLSFIIAMYKGNKRTYSEMKSFVINAIETVKEQYEK
jgi:hypothetical protein